MDGPGAVLRWQVGDVTVTRVQEREVASPGGDLCPGYVPAHLDRHRWWMAPDHLTPDGLLRQSIHALVVEAGGTRILVDTCIGNRPGPYVMPHTAFLTWLGDAGHPRESIDVVVCTHLHFDHVGWNTMWDEVGGRWVPTFPNARYLFGRDEYEHWLTHDSDIVLLADTVVPVIAAGLADLVGTGHRVCDEVRLEPTPGHTPGHVSVRIESAGQAAVITGDLFHHPLQLAEPELTSWVDVLPERNVESRRRFCVEHAAASTLVIGTHFAGPTAGHLVADGDGWRLER